MIKPFYYVCKVDENNWEVCYDNGFGETIEGKFKTEQQAEDVARGLNMTKEEIKTKWLHELRNGGHKQIQGTLKGIKSDGTIGYCCLGVLEEKVLGNYLSAEGLVEPEYDTDKPYYDNEGPVNVYEHLKKDVIGNRSLADDFIEKNDNGWTFPEIADYIEHNWDPDVDETVE